MCMREREKYAKNRKPLYNLKRDGNCETFRKKKISEEISWIGWWLNEVWSYELCLSILLCSDRKKFVLLNYFKRHF